MPKTTPFEGSSTYREQFPWKSSPRVKAVAPKACGWEPQPHAVPLQSTYKSQFEWKGAALERATAKPQHVPIPYAPFEGESTSASQFKWHSGNHKRESAKADDTREHVVYPFAGRSTYSDAYKAYAEVPPVIVRKPPDERQHIGVAKFEGSTSHREHFKEVRVPPGSSWELGVQVVGGKFHHLIARGKRPPCEGKATFTTVNDMQESVEIVVVGRAPNVKSLHLGHFKCELLSAPTPAPPLPRPPPPRPRSPRAAACLRPVHSRWPRLRPLTPDPLTSDPSPPRSVRGRRLDGITPNKAGIPQVVVTLQLDEAFKLRVTALDKQRNHSRSLVCKEVK